MLQEKLKIVGKLMHKKLFALADDADILLFLAKWPNSFEY